jgi:hypothetical protein
LIVGTNGNVVGGVTPEEWTNSGRFTTDDSARSFIFTLKNPRGVLPWKFALGAEEKQFTICRHPDADLALRFDIRISDKCNANTIDFMCVGTRWKQCTNAHCTDLKDFLTGAECFTVKEIQVFEISAETELPGDITKSEVRPKERCKTMAVGEFGRQSICRRDDKRGYVAGRSRRGNHK